MYSNHLKMIHDCYGQWIPTKLLVTYMSFVLRSLKREHQEQNIEKHVRHSSMIDIQRAMLDCTVKSEFYRKFPPPIEYVRHFLRLLIKEFEELLQENEDNHLYGGIYEIYADCISGKYNRINVSSFNDHQMSNQNELLDDLCESFRKESNIGFCTRYLDRKNSVITIETKYLVLNGTTGLRTWPGSVHMLDFLTNLSEYPDLAQKKKDGWNKIIELGSGTGFLGISLIKSGFIARGQYKFTDCKDEVLNYIRMNLFANQIKTDDLGLKLITQKYDWYDHSDTNIFNNFKCDLILASEVIFNIELFEPFLRTLRSMFDAYKSTTKSSSEHCYPDCFISNSMRNIETLNIFRKELNRFGFEAEKIDIRKRPRLLEMLDNQAKILAEKIGSNPADWCSLFDTCTDDLPTIIYQIKVKTE